MSNVQELGIHQLMEKPEKNSKSLDQEKVGSIEKELTTSGDH
jgi:hypothetical protein